MKRINHLIESALANQGFRRYFANTSWMFAEQILRMIAGLAVGVWVARYLGPSQFGILSYAVAFAAIFSAIAKLGLDSIVVRNLVHVPERRNVYLGTAFWLKVAGALAMLIVIALALAFSANDAATNLYVYIIASGGIFQAFEVVGFYFQSKVLSKFVSICKLTQLTTSSMIRLYLIYRRADLVWFVLVSLIDQVTLATAFLFAYRHQRLGAFYRQFDRTIARKLLKDGWPLLMSSVVIMLYMRIDQIMIKQWLGAKDVGIYSAAIRISEVWSFIPALMATSLFPSIINAKNRSEALYCARVQNLYALMILICTTIVVPMTFLSGRLVIVLYGVAYKDAGAVLLLSIWTVFPVFIGTAWSQWLLIEERQHLAIYSHLSGLIINVVLNYFFIPLLGIRGAAIATLLSYYISAIFAFSLYKGRLTYSLVFHLYKHGKHAASL
jgi:O-antigen/teichoic acid export membrane protein